MRAAEPGAGTHGRGVDAVVVGAGPNGLAAAITLAHAGRSVLVLEAAATAGGGCRGAELTLPGFRHDVCAAVHPLALASPFLRELAVPLARHGLELAHPPAALAHPFDDSSAAVLERSVEATAGSLGQDGTAWQKLLGPLADHTTELADSLLDPLRVPRHPLLLARFGRDAARPATRLATARFRGPQARGLLAGLAAHAMLPLQRRPTAGYRRRLARYRYGPGVVKVDWALDGPIPWKASGCDQAGTLHLGDTLDEVAAAEAAVANGGHPERPFVLLAQPSRFDPTRAPEGRHTAWAYCHVPHGSTLDPALTAGRIQAQVERFAPGFGDRILARAVRGPAELERDNANYVGGDINGGLQDLRQLITRPVPRLTPWATPLDGVYLCSSSTPPGGGVHGMCGHLAARAVLRRSLG